MPDDREMIALIKNAAKEGQFHKITTADMESIYRRGAEIAKQKFYDDDLIKAVNQFKAELKRRKGGKYKTSIFPISTPIISILSGTLLFLLIMSAVTGNPNIIIGGIVFPAVFALFNFFKKRIEPKQKADSSLGGVFSFGSSWALTALVLFAIVIAAAWLLSTFETKKEIPPQTPRFDIQGYYTYFKDVFGENAPLETVARHAYTSGDFSRDYPDYETWKKAMGIDEIVEQDTDKRKPKMWARILNAVGGLIPFRYETEQMGKRLVRYDRFTSRVEWKSVFSEDNKWNPLRYKNLQQARAVFQNQTVVNYQNQSPANISPPTVNIGPRTDDISDHFRKRETEDKINRMQHEINEMQSDLRREKMQRDFDQRERDLYRDR